MTNKSLKDYAAPHARGMSSCIALPNIEANNFEIKPGFISMIQQNQFGGGPNEDPNLHLENFSDNCSTMRIHGVGFDIVRLMLFRFSLRDRAKSWYYSLPPNSITTWEQCEQVFLNKFYPPSKTAHMRNMISSFMQIDGESLFEAWDRFKGMLRQCPHHGLEKWLVIHTFYNRINYQTKVYLDSAAGGALMNKILEEAKDLIESVALNHHQWANERGNNPKTPGKYEVDTLTLLTAKMEALNKRFDNINVSKVNMVSSSCEICEDSSHTKEMCQVGALQAQIAQYEQCDAIGTFNQRNNPYSNSYNPGWRNHPNFSYRNNQGSSYQAAPKQSEEMSDTQRILEEQRTERNNFKVTWVRSMKN
ncbi:uncharacterized protein LOC141827240 [Curcuma longa]|uniref:uncharacterized protein LOC141827240 n=1 Tax=Curcuma longa TaxID=136217 RepID=UPI003D9FAA3E